MQEWIAIGETVMPIFGLIALGVVLKQLPLLDSGGWAAVDRIVYWVFFPALLFASVARADFGGLATIRISVAMVVTVLVMTFLIFLLCRQLQVKRPARASLVMGGIRFNTFLGVALAEQLYGQVGITLAAICIGVMVPTVNVISVWTLQRGTPGGGMLKTIGSLFQNPLILACLAGGFLNLAGVEPEPVLMTGVDLLAQASLPLGLIAIGAGLAFETLRRQHALLLWGVGAKMFVQPAIGFGLLWLAGLQGAALVVPLIWLAQPAAPSSYVMARTLGGDAPLMAALLTMQVIVSVVTLPLLIGLVQ